MNKKQLISMWCGIVILVLYRWTVGCLHYDVYSFIKFFINVFIFGLITAAFIYTFRNKKQLEGEPQKPVNRRRGFRRITLLIAIVVAVICGSVAVANFRYNRIRSQNHVWHCETEFLSSIPVITDPNERAFWPDPELDIRKYCDQCYWVLAVKFLSLSTLKGDEESMRFKNKCSKCFEKAQSLKDARDFWSELSTIGYQCLLVLGGLGCAIAGFFGVWVIYGLLYWLIKGFYIDTG